MLHAIASHYFGPGITVEESPLVKASLGIPTLLGIIGILASAVIPFEYTLIACIAVFVAFTVSHVALWVAGNLYRRGLRDCLLCAGLFTAGVTVIVVVGGFLLYGWWPFAMLLMGGINAHVPPLLQPLAAVTVLVGCVAWYVKGLSIVDGPV